VRLHCLICHKGINTWRIITHGGALGGGYYDIIGILAGLAQLSQDTSISGFFWNRGKTPKNNIFEGDSKTTNPVVAKSYEKKKTISWFYHCHPSPHPSATTNFSYHSLILMF
jgi:hypothetical protein